MSNGRIMQFKIHWDLTDSNLDITNISVNSTNMSLSKSISLDNPISAENNDVIISITDSALDTNYASQDSFTVQITGNVIPIMTGKSSVKSGTSQSFSPLSDYISNVIDVGNEQNEL